MTLYLILIGAVLVQSLLIFFGYRTYKKTKLEINKQKKLNLQYQLDRERLQKALKEIKEIEDMRVKTNEKITDSSGDALLDIVNGLLNSD